MRLFQDVRPFYFVTLNTLKSRKILKDPSLHEAFVEFCEIAHERYQVSVGRYVIMPDHMHLFVSMPESGVRLQAWIKSLKSTLTYHLKSMGKEAPFWQEGFFDHVLRSADSYTEKWQYVALNPVRAGYVEQAEDWPYAGEIVRLSY